MKKTFLIPALIILGVLFVYSLDFAQRYYRNTPMDDCLYDLNLTDKQIQEINRLEIQLDKELIPIFSELRSLYVKLDELEMQRSPNQEEIDTVIEKIYSTEDKIAERENQYYDNIRSLLTEEQKARFDALYGYGPYMRSGLGRFGCGLGPYRFRGGNGRGYGRAGRGRLGYYGRGRYYGGYGQRFGYGRGFGQGRFRRFYDYRFNRRRFRW